MTRITTALSVALVLACSTQALAQTKNHCRVGETLVFSCTIAKSRKVVSLCVGESKLKYRFGKPGTVELEFPGADGGRLAVTQSDETAGSNSAFENISIAFSTAEADFVVFGRFAMMGGGGGGWDSGIDVKTKAGKTASLVCEASEASWDGDLIKKISKTVANVSYTFSN